MNYYLGVISCFISFVWAKSSCKELVKSEEIQNVNFANSGIRTHNLEYGYIVRHLNDWASLEVIKNPTTWTFRPLYKSPIYRSLTVTSTRSGRVFGNIMRVDNKHMASVSLCYLSNIDIFQYVTRCSTCTRQDTLYFIMSPTLTNIKLEYIWKRPF